MPQQAPFQLNQYPTRQAASAALAAHSVDVLAKAIKQDGHASIVLTGGSSPSDLYAAWANEHSTAVDWRKVHFFWGDERNVPHDHPDSNVVLAKAMLEALNIPTSNIHAWRTDLEPAAALQDMRQVLRKLNMLGNHSFTISIFGVGEDGHVASLFPGHAPWTDFNDQFPAVARYISDSPKPPSERFTFTFPLIMKSSHIALIPFGKTKKDVVAQICAGDLSIPATHLTKHQSLSLWTDYDL